MAEITKITTPMLPKENLGTKRPVTEQAFALNDPTKVNKPDQDKNVRERDAGGQALREALGRSAVAPLLRGTNDAIIQIQKMMAMVQMGISTSDIVGSEPMKELLRSMFVPTDQLLALLMEQEGAGVLFKGDAFDVLRDILSKFPENPNVKAAVTNLLKVFEHNVNLDNSVKTILYHCEGLLDYMFTKDRAQFGEYLDNLSATLLPDANAGLFAALREAGLLDSQGNVVVDLDLPLRGPDGEPNPIPYPGTDIPAEGGPAAGQPLTAEQIALLEQLRELETGLPMFAGTRLGVEPDEAAKLLKGNLLPLLSEIVVKYYQNEKIRDSVMVVVHNIVRVDKGTPGALWDAVGKLTESLMRVANIGENFAANLSQSLQRAAGKAKYAENEIMSKLSAVVSQTLRDPESPPIALRQAENLLMSLLQNQSSVMNVLHFILPAQTDDGLVYSEMYVDPDSEERPRGGGGGDDERARKIFLSVESEGAGSMELQFLESGERVEFAMWCADALVEPLRRVKRPLADLMLLHGFTLTGFSVDELVRHHSIVQVFPKLLDRKVGIDVKI